MSNYVQYSR